MKKKILLLLLLVESITLSFAQNGAHPPIYQVPVNVLPKGKLLYRSYLRYTPYAKMSFNGDMIDLPDDMTYYKLSYTSMFRYGVNDRFTVLLNIPVIYQSMEYLLIDREGKGIGDTKVGLVGKVYQNGKKDFQIFSVFYTKLPTGKYRDLDLDQIPLGTGSYDLGGYIVVKKNFKKFDIKSAISYVYRSKNSQDIDLGDVYKAFVSSSFAVVPGLWGELTATYTNQLTNQYNGVGIPGSSVEKTELIFGLEYKIKDGFFMQLAVPWIVAGQAQYLPNNSFWLGFSYMF